MKKTLILLAAGMGSRYGGNKQIDRFGPNGETLSHYAILDAWRAGFSKVIFIIRKEMEAEVNAAFAPFLVDKMDFAFAFQTMDAPAYIHNIDRQKPWGTVHALLSAAPLIDTPFVVLNADDFYGKMAFQQAAAHLDTSDEIALMGYQLRQTLSAFGGVTRGICAIDTDNHLTQIVETDGIIDKSGKIGYEKSGTWIQLPENAPVSMNFWGMQPAHLQPLETCFEAFVATHKHLPKAELPLPTAISQMLSLGYKVKVLQTDAAWFGVTYAEDKRYVQNRLRELTDYLSSMWK